MKFWLALMTYLHILAIAAYVGGAFVMEYVLAPAQKAIPPAQAQVMGEKTSNRYLIIAWSALAVLAITCTARLFMTNQLAIRSPFFRGQLILSNSYGRTTLLLFVLWLVLVVNGAILTWKIRPTLGQKHKASASAAGVAARQDEQIKAAKWASRLVRADMVIGLLAAIVGVALRYGGLI